MLTGSGSLISFHHFETNLQEFIILFPSFVFEELKDVQSQLDHMKKFVGFVVS
jgi:hypothetical protein